MCVVGGGGGEHTRYTRVSLGSGTVRNTDDAEGAGVDVMVSLLW